MHRRLLLLPVIAFSCSAFAYAQADAGSIRKELGTLRSTPEADRGAKTGAIAREIGALPASKEKTSLAIGLSHLATEGDPGRDNLQAVTTTLAQALTETPVPTKGDLAGSPYLELAELVRYEGMSVPQGVTEEADYKTAVSKLVADDEQVNSANFTLRDLHGKKWTLQDLRGKIVMVNFWATWCPPCRQELPNLDAIAEHYAPEGLVILALTDEDAMKVNAMFHGANTHFVVLLDDGRKVANTFHVAGIPRTFVFGRDGKLAAEAIDARTQRQFLTMLSKAGLKPLTASK